MFKILAAEVIKKKKKRTLMFGSLIYVAFTYSKLLILFDYYKHVTLGSKFVSKVYIKNNARYL